MTAEALEIRTPHGPARAYVDAPAGARATLVLGHGAGGGVHAPDLCAACAAAEELALSTVLVEQPYRVAGRRSTPRAPILDAAWLAVIDELRHSSAVSGHLIAGGRSAGARVACRTSLAAGASAVLCLAFPLQPPGIRRDGSRGPDRLDELDGVRLPTLVVQGERDRFGIPPQSPNREVVIVRGDHGLKSDATALHAAVSDWLRDLVRQSGRRESNPP